jgi:hypothetical protein
VFSSGVVVENPCSILDVPEESLNRATQPKALVNVVSKTSSAHSITVPWSPDPLGSQGHPGIFFSTYEET